MARSEAKKVGNAVYQDLSMTSYPDFKDALQTNATTNEKKNDNMLGWQNIGDGANPDYTMAEHVNALIDGIRAIQRALGVNPMLPVDVSGLTAEQLLALKQTNTVKKRIDELENRNYDERYGGIGWTPSPDRTISKHYHNGTAGNPPKVQLGNAAEIQGKLPKANLDLTSATGVTGSDIKISTGNNTSIEDSISEKLSTVTGGTVSGHVVLEKKFQSRTQREIETSDFSGTTASDTQTLSGTRKELTGTGNGTFLRMTVSNLQYGCYTLGVRVKLVSGSLGTSTILRLKTEARTNDAADVLEVSGEEFENVGKWKMVYLVFDHEPGDTNKAGELVIEKVAGTSASTIAIDHAYIVPSHPGVFDK